RGALDELPEPLRSQTEEAYLAACREVGQLMLDAGKYREGWMYLRPTGDKEPVREALGRAIPDDENTEELIEVALHEAVSPRRGIAWMLAHYGTCNSITTFEGLASNLPREDQQACAAVLVRHLHDELIGNVRSNIEQQEESLPPDEATLTELVVDHPWLLQNESYHVDTSHLGATVRFARLLTDPQLLRLALALTEYGLRLARLHQFPGEEPFVDVYPSHRLLFSATLGERVDEAVRFFAKKAREVSVEEHGTGAIEAYLVLLVRLERYEEALEEMGRLVPSDVALSSYAPTMLELARESGAWERYLELARQREDAVGFAAGLVESRTRVTEAS
ncbi:MAG: hypothetical protein O7F08_06375, partial [Deltaproteobacteria bacterium]|nr:hypothetical protein [Deltaproteobacteria bacterium]